MAWYGSFGGCINVDYNSLKLGERIKMTNYV